jgi:hypothetical protein
MSRKTGADYLAEILMQKADTIKEIHPTCDIRVSVYRRADVIRKIQAVDSAFCRSLAKTGSLRLSFSYGDKYFMPISDTHLTCIPYKVINWYEALKELGYPKELCDWARTDQAKLRSKIKRSGYLDTFNLVRYTAEFEVNVEQ